MGALPAWAHHATGKPPETLLQGLLSGLVHPVIGPDHFLFLLLLGTLACGAGTRPRFRAVVASLVGSVAGVLALVGGVVLPAVEPFVALSIIGGGAIVALRPRANPRFRDGEAAPGRQDGDQLGPGSCEACERPRVDRHRLPFVLVMIASIFHGYAFAESALGAPAPAFGTYVLGLSLAQAAIILGVARLAARSAGGPELVHGKPRVFFAVHPAAGVASVLTGGLLLGSFLL